MKKILGLLLFVLAFCMIANATQLTGTLKKPDGTGFTGTLYLSIAQQVGISTLSGCGGPVLVTPTVLIPITVTNGSATWPNVYGAQCTLPAGMPYNAVLKDTNGNIMFSTMWLITGTTQDVGTVYQGPAQLPPTALVIIYGVGAPVTLDCSANTMYIQQDAAVGTSLWPCINGFFVQQGGGTGSGSLAIGVPISSGAALGVLYEGPDNTLHQDANFQYNENTHELFTIVQHVQGTITALGGFVGNATSATGFAILPALCSSGQYPQGVDISGNAVNCTTPPGSTGALIPNTTNVLIGSGSGDGADSGQPLSNFALMNQANIFSQQQTINNSSTSSTNYLLQVLASGLPTNGQVLSVFGSANAAHSALYLGWNTNATPHGLLETNSFNDPIEIGASQLWIEANNVAIGNNSAIGSSLPGMFNVGPANQFQVDNAGNVIATSLSLTGLTVGTAPICVGTGGILTQAGCTGGGGGGGATGPQYHVMAFVGAGSGSAFAAGPLAITTDASTSSDLIGIGNSTITKTLNGQVNYDGFGSYAAIAASSNCASGCDIAVWPNSPSTENPYTAVLNNVTHVNYRLGGSEADIYNNVASGFNGGKYAKILQCNVSGNTTVGNQISSCLSIADTIQTEGTYQGSPWQVHSTLPIETWAVGEGITQVMSVQYFHHHAGDGAVEYDYMHARCGLIAGSDEGCFGKSLQILEDPPLFGSIVTGGASATVIKSNFTTNNGNQGTGFDLVSLDSSDTMASGFMVSQTMDTATNTFMVTTSDTHAVSTGIEKIVTSCGVIGQSRNNPVSAQCLVTKIGTLPSTFTASATNNACVADNGYPEQAIITAVGTGTAFQTNHLYNPGDQFYDGANYQEVLSGGTSPATHPTWSTTLNGETTDSNGVIYQLVALGSNSQVLTMNIAFEHTQGIVIAQGGLCGAGRIDGAGSTTPTAVGVWQSIPIMFSETSTSFNYVAAYEGDEEGVQSRTIPHFPTTGMIGSPSLSFNSISRVGHTVTVLLNGGNSTQEFNGWVPPNGASIVVSTGNSNFDTATTFSNFAVTNIPFAVNGFYEYQLTYTDNLSATASAGSGTLQVNGMNNYVAQCRAETLQVLNTIPRGPGSDSGLPWGDGTLQVEPNHCHWPTSGLVAQPNHFATGVSGMRISSNIITPVFVNSNKALLLDLTGIGNSGTSYLCLNCEGRDPLNSFLGYGGSNAGHIAIFSEDYFSSMFIFNNAPIYGGPFISIGNRPTNAPYFIYPFAALGSDVGNVLLNFDTHTGNFDYEGPGLFGAQNSTMQTLEMKLNIRTNPTGLFSGGVDLSINNAYLENEYGFTTLSTGGNGRPSPENNAYGSDYSLSVGSLYGAKLYSGALLPINGGIFPQGTVTVGTSTWCYAAVATTSVGHSAATTAQCITNGPATLSAGTEQLFAKYFPQQGGQSITVYRTASPNTSTYPLGKIGVGLNGAQGVQDFGQAPTDSVNPTTLLDTSGSAYFGGVIKVADPTTPGTIDTGVTVSGTSCTVKAIVMGIITSATCP